MDAGMNRHIAFGFVIVVAFLRSATGWARYAGAVLIVAFTPRIVGRRAELEEGLESRRVAGDEHR